MPARKKNKRERKGKTETVVRKIVKENNMEQPKKKRGRPKKIVVPEPVVIVPKESFPEPVTLNDVVDADLLNHSRLFNFQKRKTMCSAILAKYCADVKDSLSSSNSFTSNEISNINATIKSIDDFLKNWNTFTLQVVDVLNVSTDQLIQRTVQECSNLVCAMSKKR